ncbi:hypothetical protein CYMTET_50091 [Cymbomonas tetramitiformis]|uniref:Uncharacterized protein n=1 Tax=Cymbomonas tetramitiformis TaxID=36881 RepID=A0AAE0BNV8_9CHLO|nr:hypothetical protein CYMTET_50091 [Cymbomonas tetramitiformis]
MVQTTTERLTSLHNVYNADEEILTSAEIKELREKERALEKARRKAQEDGSQVYLENEAMEAEEEEADNEAEEEAEEEAEDAEEPPAQHAPGEKTPVLLLEPSPAEQTQELEAMLDAKHANAAAAAGSEAGRAESENPDRAWALAAHVETQNRVSQRKLQATPGNDEAATQETQKKAAALGQADQAEQAEDAAGKAKTGKAAAKAAPTKAATADGILTRTPNPARKARTPGADKSSNKRTTATATAQLQQATAATTTAEPAPKKIKIKAQGRLKFPGDSK